MADKLLASIKAKSDVPSECGPTDAPAETGGTGAVAVEPRIVMDCGSNWCRIGYAGDDYPRQRFETMVGRLKQQMSSDKASSFVGGAAYEQRGFLDISHPIERGIITNWSDMEKVWQHMFHQLKVNPEDKTVLLGDSCRNAVKHSAREKMVKYISVRGT